MRGQIGIAEWGGRTRRKPALSVGVGANQEVDANGRVGEASWFNLIGMEAGAG